jgi:hypothetical protein
MSKRQKLHDGQMSPFSMLSTLDLGGVRNWSSFGINPGGGWGGAADYLFAVPHYFGRDYLLKEYGFIVATFSTGGQNIAVGIYADYGKYSQTQPQGFDFPGDLIDSFEQQNIQAVGFYKKTLDPPLLLKGNRIYWGVFTHSLTGSCTYVGNGHPNVNFGAYYSASIVCPVGIWAPRTYVYPLPTTFPASSADGKNQNGTIFFREVDDTGA